jgi:ribonuclease VapC
MVIATSTLLAILQDEPERRAFSGALEAADSRALSAVNFVETSIVLEARHGADGFRNLDLFLDRTWIELAAVGAVQARIACKALNRLGKGRHRAGLNFGDCFAYDLASARGEMLLFKGDNVAQTALVGMPREL